MQIVRVHIENFRGVREADIDLEGTVVLLGDNNTGKSTIFEAIELAIGADRLSRVQAIDEHDFFGGKYQSRDGQPANKIVVEATITDLDDQLCTKFRSNLEFWQPATQDMASVLLPASGVGSKPAVRIRFGGAYDADADEFVAKTWFAVPRNQDGIAQAECRSSDKREFGFLHLRALRTGSRALSMERGSLLDVILRTYDVRARMWEGLLEGLRDLDVVGAKDPKFGRILADIRDAMREIVPGEWADAPHLRVSELTREDLRRVLKSFLATGVQGYAAPFQHQGSGTINALVLSMLGLIAQRRNGRIIFAMEEPEISLPPHVQKRVVDKVRDLASQALFTSHSPYVIEQFAPEQMTVMRRDETGLMRAARVVLPSNLRPKLFRDGFRTKFCEALLARRVLIVEGKTELVAYSAAARIAATLEPKTYERLDALGWVPFDAGSETAVADFARFFRALGKTTATIFDRQNPEAKAAIMAECDASFEQPHKGFEDMMRYEIHAPMQEWFVNWLNHQGEWPAALANMLPPACLPQEAFVALFKHKKASDFIDIYFENCAYTTNIPHTMRDVLIALKNMVAPPTLPSQVGAPALPDLFG